MQPTWQILVFSEDIIEDSNFHTVSSARLVVTSWQMFITDISYLDGLLWMIDISVLNGTVGIDWSLMTIICKGVILDLIRSMNWVDSKMVSEFETYWTKETENF